MDKTTLIDLFERRDKKRKRILYELYFDLITSRLSARYIAEISYALYIFHGALNAGWLGSGSKVVKYAKRPLLLAVTFALAHISTFRFEQPCIALAKRLTRGVAIRAPA